MTPPEPVLIVLFVDDPARSRAFWAATLDASPTLDVPGMVQFSLSPGGGDAESTPAPGVALGLMSRAGIRALLGEHVVAADPSVPPRSELYLRVPDIDAVWQRAIEAGATALQPIAMRSWGERAGYLRDPDGHLLALAEADRSATGGPRTPTA